MTNIRSLITRYSIACASLQIGAIVFMTLPWFEAARASLAASFGISPNGLWAPIALLLVGAMAFASWRLGTLIANPLVSLIRQAESNRLGFAFQQKSKIMEDGRLRHFIESQSARLKELEDQMDGFENSATQSKEALDKATLEREEGQKELLETKAALSQARAELEKLEARNAALAEEIASERRSKVGREVQMRTEEIYAQMSKAVEASALKKIWLPSALQELRGPISIIQDIAKRLESKWQETSLGRLQEEIATIRQQSESQLELLDRIGRHEPNATLDEPLQTRPADPGKSEERRHPSSANGHSSATTASHDREKPSHNGSNGSSHSKLDLSSINGNGASGSPFASQGFKTTSMADIEIPADLKLPNELDELRSEPRSEPDAQNKAFELELANEQAVASVAAPEPETFTRVDRLSRESIDPTPKPNAVQEDLGLFLQKIAAEYERPQGPSIELCLDDDLEIDVSPEPLESILRSMLEVAVSQISEGNVYLDVRDREDYLDFSVTCRGRPRRGRDLDITQANRIAAALDGRVSIDIKPDRTLKMSFKYDPEAQHPDEIILN